MGFRSRASIRPAARFRGRSPSLLQSCPATPFHSCNSLLLTRGPCERKRILFLSRSRRCSYPSDGRTSLQAKIHTTMNRLLSYLPLLRRDQDGVGNGDGPENWSSDGQSSSTDGKYGDCESDAESSREEVFPGAATDGEKENSIPPSSSSTVVTGPFTAPSDSTTDGSFTALDPEDDFVQTIAHLKNSGDSSQKISTPSRKGFEQTPNFPASEPFSPKTSSNNHLHRSSDADLLPRRLAQVVVGGSTVYKNQLHTLCQRGRIPIPTYTHAQEGLAHAPSFTASVWVSGEKYESVGNFTSKGEAQQAAAKAALTILFPDQSHGDKPDVEETLTGGLSAAESSTNSTCTGFPTQPQRIYTQQQEQQQQQQKFNSGPPKLDNGHGGNGTVIESSAGATNVAGKDVKTGGQVKNDIFEESPTIHSVIDLDEECVGSSSQLSKAGKSARSESASRAHEQLWGPLRKEGCSAASQPQEIAGQFSRLKANKSIPVTKSVTQARERKWPNATKHMEALGKLEFSTQAFPLLTRLDRLPLEEAYSVDEIEGIHPKYPDEVHQYLLDVDAKYDRPNNSVPPPTVPEFRLYDCYISTNPRGEHKFKISENRQGSTVLQRRLGFDKVLRVFFEGTTLLGHYKGILTNGIFVGPRFYQYFVHKVADDKETGEEKRKEEKQTEEEKRKRLKCYFICTDSRGESDLNSGLETFRNIAEARYLFAHVDTCATVCKYIARLQLCLSKTITIEGVSFSDLHLREKADLPSKDAKSFFTDGTGLISTDLARKMPKAIMKGSGMEGVKTNDKSEDYPSLIQVRFFHQGAAHKGTLLAHKELESNTIEYYSSMKKVECNPSISGSISSFELVSTSRRPKRAPARLSQDLIVLLSIGGVEESIFLDAVKSQIEKMRKTFSDRERAIEVTNQSGWKADLVETTIRMLAAGIPMEEPCLQTNLRRLVKFNLEDLAKGKVPLEDSFYLMGTADPTGTLKTGEVVIFSDGKFVVGEVLLHKHPGKHPGDIHKVQAVYSKAIESIIGGEKNLILFSTQGSRPLPDEMGGSDLDGDEYWICVNKKVVEQFKDWPKRWTKGHVDSEDGKGLTAPRTLSADGLEDALAEEYLNERFEKIDIVGMASYRWLVHADAYLNPETAPKEKEIHLTELLKYPDYVYEAVDFKSGKQVLLFPEHQLCRRYRAPYLPKWPSQDAKGGKSILGQIHVIGRAASREMKDHSYCRDDYRANPDFYVQGSDRHIEFWEAKIKRYFVQMAQALEKEKGDLDTTNARAFEVNNTYRKLLFGAPSLEEMTKDRQTVFEEASAIYQIVYRKAKEDIVMGKAPKHDFAWNVAGVALARIYAEKQPGDSVTFSRDTYNKLLRRST